MNQKLKAFCEANNLTVVPLTFHYRGGQKVKRKGYAIIDQEGSTRVEFQPYFHQTDKWKVVLKGGQYGEGTINGVRHRLGYEVHYIPRINKVWLHTYIKEGDLNPLNQYLVEVKYSNGDKIKTRINGSKVDVQRYYKLGKWFNIGSVRDNMQMVTGLKFIEQTR